MIPAPQLAAESPAETKKASLTELSVAQPVIARLLQQWRSVETAVANARKDRRQRIDIEALRAAGKLKAHEKHIGVRVIDNNIKKDLPPYISYLKQSRRAGIFKPVGVPKAMTPPTDIVTQLESEVSDLLRYTGWEFEYIRWLDGSELHGYDWMEVLYDDTKPGHVATNHVGTVELIYDLAVRNIQDSRVVMRRYRPTLVMLEQLAAKNGFDENVVKILKQQLRQNASSTLAENAEHQHDSTSIMIYKVMFKERGVVMVGWYTSLTGNANAKWLREPRVFWNGVKEKEVEMQVDPQFGIQNPVETWRRVPETNYPYYVLHYQITEDATIAETQGRGEMDLHLQEASTTIFSSVVTQAQECAQTMWAPESNDPSVGGTAPKQLQAVVKKGAIWDRPMKAFNAPPPDPMLPKVIDMLDTRAAENINQPAWTVNNREDSRKTATEVHAASQAQVAMNSVSVVVLSVSVQLVFEAAWRIIQSQALQGNIQLLVDDTGANNIEVIGLQWKITPAGDVDYIEREEQAQKMQQDWPVIQNTGAAPVFIEEYLRLRYPKIADRFIEAIKAGDIQKQAIMSLSSLLKAAVVDETGALKPEWAAHAPQLQQVQQQVQQALAMP